MRTRYLVLPGLFSLAFLYRQHIRDLSEVASTYAFFHKYLQSNQHVLARYPSQVQSSDSDGLVEPVPKIIHQIFLSRDGSDSGLAKYRPAIESCKAIHPSWTFHMWTNDNATNFMADFYPKILPHYVGYKQNIQRANILRYALLEHYGGVYLDLDITCLAPLDAPLNAGSDRTLAHLPFITPGAYPAGVNNAFILSRPHHPFMKELLHRVPSRDLSWPMPYVENMLSTGCMFFSNVWMSHALRLERKGRNLGTDNQNRVYILADESGGMDSHMLRGAITTPLFVHGGASSWHGWDAAMFIVIGKHYGWFAFAAASVLALILVVARRLLVDRKGSGRIAGGSRPTFGHKSQGEIA